MSNQNEQICLTHEELVRSFTISFKLLQIRSGPQAFAYLGYYCDSNKLSVLEP